MAYGHVYEVQVKDLQISVGRFVREAKFRKGSPRRFIEKNVLAPGQCLVVGKEIVAITFIDSIVRRGNTHSTKEAASEGFMLTSSVPELREEPAADGAIAVEVIDGATQNTAELASEVVDNEATAQTIEVTEDGDELVTDEAVELEEVGTHEADVEVEAEAEGVDTHEADVGVEVEAEEVVEDEAEEAVERAIYQPGAQTSAASSRELDDGATRPEPAELAYSDADSEQTEVDSAEPELTQAAAGGWFRSPPSSITRRPQKSRKVFKATGLRPSRIIASSLPVTRVADRAITRGQVPGMHATQTRVADQTITRGQVPGMHATQTVMYGAPLQQGGAPKLALVQQPEPAQQAPSATSQNPYRRRRSWHELEAQRARENELDFDDVLAEYGIFPGDPGDSIGFRPCSVDNPYPGAPRPAATPQPGPDVATADPALASIGDVLRDFAQCNRKLLETNQQLQSALLEGQRTTTPPSQSQASSPPKAATDNRALVYEVASAIIYLADFVVNGGLTT